MAREQYQDVIRRYVTGAMKQIAEALNGIVVPGKVVTANFETDAVYVGRGNICRIEVSGDVHVAFGNDTIGAVTATTSPATKLIAPGANNTFYNVIAGDDYIRCDNFGNVARLEVINV